MNSKTIIISPHARFEMQRRGITAGQVVSAVRHPDQVLPSRKGRAIFQSKVGLRGQMLLRVVVKELANGYHVVTAYKTSRITKYWKKS